MTNIDPWSMTGWVLYRFFPAARTLDYRDFMTGDHFSNAMHDAGFVDVEALTGARKHPRGSRRVPDLRLRASCRTHGLRFEYDPVSCPWTLGATPS